jgi:flagellar biogenesis protein FliO
MLDISYYIKALFSLAVVLGVLYMILRASKALHRHHYSGEMKIRDRLMLEQNVSLMIVTVRDKDLLVSVAGKDLKILDTLGESREKLLQP